MMKTMKVAVMHEFGVAVEGINQLARFPCIIHSLYDLRRAAEIRHEAQPEATLGLTGQLPVAD